VKHDNIAKNESYLDNAKNVKQNNGDKRNTFLVAAIL